MPPLAALLIPLLAPATPPRPDADGIPLPAEAVCRLGSTRFRLGSTQGTAVVSRDGRTLYALAPDRGRCVLLALDATTGVPVFRVPLPSDCSYRYGGGDVRCVAEAGAVRVEWTMDKDWRFRVARYDPATGLPLGPPQTLLRNVFPNQARLSPAGTYVARVVEDVVRRVGIDETDHILTVAPARGGPAVEVARRRTGLNSRWGGFAHQFAPDDRFLAVADRGDSAAVALFDPATGKRLRELAPGEGTVAGFVVSPSGREVGGWVRREKDLTFAVWDADTGRRRDVFTTDPADDPCAVFLGDGGRVAHRVFSVDEAGRVPDRDKIGWHVRDATTGKVVHTLRVLPGEAVFSPDGAVHYFTEFGVVTPVRVATGAVVNPPDPPGVVRLARFAADGRVLAISREWNSGAHQLLGWDPRTGRLVSRGHRFRPDSLIGLAMIGDAYPDGGRVAVLGRAGLYDPYTLRVCDAATGAVRATIPLGNEPGEDIRFSDDGRRVYTASSGKKDVRAWDAATGRPIADPGRGPFGQPVTSPDGRTRADPSDPAGVRLIETATGAVRHTFGGHAGYCHDLAFSPDGRYLAADSNDAPILVWDVRGGLSKPPAPPGADALAAAWADLASADAGRGFRAVRLLAHFPDRAVPLLRDKLPPARGPSAAEVATLVAALDAPAFADREAAEKALKKLGTLAEPALREALASTSSAEMRQRAGRLLAPLAAGTPSAEDVRAVRAVEAVEWMGTPAARALLSAWASGAEGARLTREASRFK